MKIVSSKKVTNLICKLLLLLILFVGVVAFSGCGTSYNNLQILLSNQGRDVTLYIQNGVSTTEEIVVNVQTDNNNINRQVNVSTESDKLNIITTYNNDGTTTLTLTANVAKVLSMTESAVFKDALVMISTKEGGKFASFYVSVEIEINEISETANEKELYAVKGASKNLNPSKLLTLDPFNTTQKGIIFSLYSTTDDAVISNNVLTISEEYSESTIMIKAESAHDSEKFVVFSLEVIEPLNENQITYSAYYTNTNEEVDLSDTVKIAKNIESKNYITFYVSIPSERDIIISPYMQSSLNLVSEFAGIESSEKTFSDGKVEYTFIVNAESVSGAEALLFEISYVDYNYSITSKPFNLEIYDAVTNVDIFVNDVSPINYEFVVYDLYHNTVGLKINAQAFPTSVPSADKILILKLGTNASDYYFYDMNGFVINFNEGQFEYQSGENIFVKAKSGASADALFTISSKTDETIFKQFKISAQTGASNLSFTNAVSVNNQYYYYLTSNESMDQKIEFTVNNAVLNDINIIGIGNSFEVKLPVYQGATSNSFYFFINSIQNAPDERGTVTILLKNGLSAGAYVEVFSALDEDQIGLSIPGTQHNSAIGFKELLTDQTINGEKYNLEFSVAIQNNKSIGLSVFANSNISIDYTFYEMLLEGSAYDQAYTDFSTFSEANGNTNVDNYLTTSSTIRSLFLKNLNEISATQIGKVWVRAEVKGYDLNEEGIKVETSYFLYFLVEVYNPVTTFALSKSAITLYSKESVGDLYLSSTFEQLSVLLNSDATYNKITWTNSYADFGYGENFMTYSLNNLDIFKFTNNINNVFIEAFSTLESYDYMGQTYFKYASSRDFKFVAKISEFGKYITISLKLTIKKAEQVKNIVVDNLNIDNGIYLELDYKNDIYYLIIARADNGTGNPKPLSDKLIYDFMPDGSTSPSLLSIDRNTGWITIKKEQTTGGFGVIRVAPADRFINGQYVPGETDIAVYIRITVADGRSRETAYRITEFTDITNPLLHYILLKNTEINSENEYGLFETFSGGLYGSVNPGAYISTIITNKTLFKTITQTAVVEDLILCGNINDSYSGFIAEINNGKIKNVTVDTNTQTGEYLPSSLTVGAYSYAGGIVGENFGQIEKCNFYGKISAENSIAGGIAGYNEGNISYCTVEFYNFTNEYAKIIGAGSTGGLVGELAGGALEYCYVYSYVSTGDSDGPKNYMNLNILSGINTGALVGLITNGNINICFAYVNDVNSLIGQVAVGGAGTIENAYLIYNVTNNLLSAKYVYYGTSDYNYNNINSDAIWNKGTAGINNGYPYFKAILHASSTSSIGSTLNTELTNMISVEAKSVIFYYEATTALTKQELARLTAINTISYSALLGASDVAGIRAISSNNSIIGAYSNGIVINGAGTVTLTLISKYDYSISKTFVIYVIYPTMNFKLSYDNNQFDNGSVINSKLDLSLVLHGSVSEQVLLVDRNINLVTNNLSVIFNSYASYITGSGMGGFVFDTQSIYDTTGLTEVQIDFTLRLANLPTHYNVFASASSELTQINNILFDYFSSYFILKMYKGADSLVITSSDAEIEPSDIYNFEAYIFSDMAFGIEAGVFNGEGLGINIFDNGTEIAYEILNTEINEENNSVTYYVGRNSETMFVITAQLLKTIYYLSTTDLSRQTQDDTLAVYYQHQFAISVTIADNYKNYNFNNKQYTIQIYALSSMQNAENYDSNLVFENFNLTVKSQSVLSINSNHYSINSKTSQVIGDKNVVYYNYQQQTSSVMNPGGEGLLVVDLYPVYASFEYLTVTYQSSVAGDYQLRLALMTKQGDSYIKNTKDFINLPNGIRINNSYIFDGENFVSLTNLYLSTFVSENIDRDLVFTITITAYNGANDQVGVSVSTDLIIQYLKGASVSVQDSSGQVLDAVVRGATEYLVIVVDSEQNLGTINFKGCRFTPDFNNIISYSSFTEIISSENGTKTYKATLSIGTGLQLENDSNYFTIEVTISWIANGKMQTKTTALNIGLLDFSIESVLLDTDKIDKTKFVGYIGIQSSLNFDFNVKDFLTPSQFINPALQEFYQNCYYKDASGLNSFGDYVVNYELDYMGSFIENLYYVNGNNHLQVINSNGTLVTNNYFTFVVDENGVIKIVGKRAGNVPMLLSIPVKLPSYSQNLIKYIDFYFTISIELYSDEDTPLIIDSEEAFYNAVEGENPQNYILMSDLYLSNYAPYNTTGIASLDGNNFVINILSWNLEAEGNSLKLALFNNVSVDTTLKNLIVNVYHASSILVDTTKYSNVEVAGLALKNEGIIYNCQVVAYKSIYALSNATNQGLSVSYSMGQIDSSKNSRLAGFVLDNNGSITNSRVGGTSIEFALSGIKELTSFNLSAQGSIAGFVYNNNGNISSSFFSNGTITNYTSSGMVTFTAGFAGTNSGSIQISYAKGVGQNEFSLSTGGINTASISAGFIYNNKGNIGDCYSNIILTTANNATKTEYASGRLTSGFVYNNEGNIERCYTASKIEDAKTTQMNFVGVDNFGEMKNTGTIFNSYYFNIASDLDDAYASADSKISVRRIVEPDLKINFYGLTFADSAQSLNGVWYISSTGPELISANQIAVSSRYLANVERDEITGSLISYSLPYNENYEYGSAKNPIIIRNAYEFDRVFGGNNTSTGSAIASYYDLTQKIVFGNYRVVTNINLSDLLTDEVSGVKINSSNMKLSGGILDGNMFTLKGLELVAKVEATVKNYGMFASLENNAIIMNLKIEVIGVSAVTVQNVGAVAGSVNNSKLVNLVLYSGVTGEPADVVGNNMVGGAVGKVIGESEIKNITATSISVVANHVATGTSQRYNRDETATNRVNSNVSYSGGIAGIVDIYDNDNKYSLAHNARLINPQLAFLTVNGSMRLSGSSVGGITGYLGPQSLIKDATFELSVDKNQKLISYNFSAGGIVGECYGDLDMVRTQHEYTVQTLIENSVSSYYSNPASTTVERGNLSLFEHEETGKYSPKYIGGLIGELITGNISHSYSKLPVRNSNANYAGGVVGAITFAENLSINNINFYEVYTFSDVFASVGNGGISGYIDQTRTLSFDKVNAVNYWTLIKDEANNTYYLPESYYDIFALTGTKNIEAKYLKNIVQNNDGDISIKAGFSKYTLPVITQEVNSDDVFAMSKIKFSYNGQQNEIAVQKSYASLGSNNYFKIIDEDLQAIIPLFDYHGAAQSGSEMDAYFRNSDWDPNFWKRYQSDMLPSLITSAEVSIFYIMVAEDLLNMIYYPDATFIVIGKDGNGIVKVGNYINNTGWSLNNFSGVLKGYDDSGNYGFDFEDYSITFINSTLTGSKIYNLTIKNIGSSNSPEYQENIGSLIGSSINTGFENLKFVKCLLYSYATQDNCNIGLLCGHIIGGYTSNISFEDCSVNVFVMEEINTLNVGLMAGRITSPVNGYMQISDITAYMSIGNVNSSYYNRVKINVNGLNVSNINSGTIAGLVDGSAFLNYSSKTVLEDRTKNLGVSDTAGFNFAPDTVSGSNYNGLVLDITGAGTVNNYNAGIGFGSANSLNLSYLRTSSSLKVAGAIISTGSVIVNNATLGGYVGKSLTSSVITNGSGSAGNYMFVDCDINFTAGSMAAGMLIGEANNIYALKNVDTYGTIKVNSLTSASYIGGIVGVLNSDLDLKNCISRTAINFTNDINNASALGGFIGFISSPNSKVSIGEDFFASKYLGTMTISANNLYVGGIIGAINALVSGSIGANAGITLNSAVFGGKIIINQTNQAYVGGIVGATNYNDGSGESIKLIENCFSYGEIYINEDFADNETNTFAGGIIGRGSSGTLVNSNFSALTVYTKFTQTESALTVNAVVGSANGSITENELKNYYCHQLSLCLDNSGILAENIYFYKKETPASKTLYENAITLYLSRLSTYDLEREAFVGSKLNPYIITNANYSTISAKFADTSEANIKYFVISENLNPNLMNGVQLNKGFVLGDGYSVRTTNGAIFSKIDANSTVTGFAIKAQINTNLVTNYSKEGTTYNGGGTLANINNGFVYSCNVTEMTSAKNFGVYGLINTNSGPSAYIGGLIGVNTGYVSDCFANLDVAGKSLTGGFAGINLGVISHSYSNGTTCSGSTPYSFAQNTVFGSIYYCYTVSTPYTALVNGPNVEISAIASNYPFGAGLVEGCVFDIFAVNSSSETGRNITDRMAVANEANVLPDLSCTITDPDTGRTYQKVFLKNEDNINDKAEVKFGYDYSRNNGYLSFAGTAYSSLSYMQDMSTGNGYSIANAIEIPNVGKLQQINDTLQHYNYVLVRDIVATTIMKSSNADPDITNWKAIGTLVNAFRGTITGQYNMSERYSITGLALGNATDYNSIFGQVQNSNISYINIDSVEMTAGSGYSAGFISEATNVEISNITIGSVTIEGDTEFLAGFIAYGQNAIISNVILEEVSLTYKASSSAFLGGFAGGLNGESSITDCSIGAVDIKYTGASASNASHLGGFVGKISGNVELLNCDINGGVDLKYNSIGGSYVGGIVGLMEGTSSNDAVVSGTDISGNINISNLLNSNSSRIDCFGSLAGVASYANFNSITISGTKNTFVNNIGACSMGGLVGEANNETSFNFTTIISNASCEFTVNSTNNATVDSFVGGVFGKISDLELASSYTVPNFKVNFDSTRCKPNIGGFAGLINSTSLSNIGVNFRNDQIDFYSSSGATFGGIAGATSGICSVSNCTVSYENNTFDFSIAEKIDQVQIGGIVGTTAGNFNISSCTITNFDINNLYVGSGAVGGLIATANSQVAMANCAFKNSEITVKATGEMSLGGFVGKITSTASRSTFNECESDKIKLTINEGSTANIGGVIGFANGLATLTNCDVKGAVMPTDLNGTILKFVASEAGSSNSNVGGIIGNASGSSADGITFETCQVTQNCNLISENQSSTSGLVHIGGIAGHILNSKIGNNVKVINFHSTYSDNGLIYLGGIVGKSENSNIVAESGSNIQASNLKLILASGDVFYTPSASGSGYVGGITGWLNNTNISYAQVDGTSVVANGSSNSSCAGGIVGSSNGTSNIDHINSDAKVISFGIAGGIVGSGSANISYANNQNASTIYAGRTVNSVFDSRGNNLSFSFNNAGTPYAGGIAGILNFGEISNCTNSASVYAGYKTNPDFNWQNNPRSIYNDMKNWGVGRAEIQDNTGSVESYAGGIAGHSGSAVQISNSNNSGYIEAKANESLITMATVYYPAGVYGDHTLFTCYYKERAYANGISHIENGASITSCHNSAQVNGGQETGFNYVYNTPWGGIVGNEKFYLLQYGTLASGPQAGQNFNAIWYLYTTDWSDSDEIRNYFINSYAILGMYIVLVGNNDFNATHINLFYGNQICNNPTLITYQPIDLVDFRQLENVYAYFGANQVSNCTYSGSTTKQLLPSTFGEPVVTPETGSYYPITWPPMPKNDYYMGVTQG